MTRLSQGWICVPYEDDEMARIEIGYGIKEPTVWRAAFLDFENGERVAKIRWNPDPSQEVVRVWLRVNGARRSAGTVRLPR